MPRFLYSVVFIGLISTLTSSYILIFKTPDSTTTVIQFLMSMFVASTAWGSLLLLIFTNKAQSSEKDKKRLYRDNLKKTLIITVYLLALALLKYTQLLNLTTGILFTALYGAGYYSASRLSR